MTDPESFLSRWARKKRDAAGEATPEPAISGSASLAAGAASGAHSSISPASKKAPEAPFDPVSLPSLDSIGAQTDIRAFLQAGVPPDLARAALRRAWTADPAIRNFKGLQENDWDFNDPNSMFGFGELGPDFDLKRMLASVFGETPTQAERPPPSDGVIAESAPLIGEDTVIKDRQRAECGETLPGINNEAKGLNSSDATSRETVADIGTAERAPDAATQQGTVASATMPGIRVRRHGGALPQ